MSLYNLTASAIMGTKLQNREFRMIHIHLYLTRVINWMLVCFILFPNALCSHLQSFRLLKRRNSKYRKLTSGFSCRMTGLRFLNKEFFRQVHFVSSPAWVAWWSILGYTHCLYKPGSGAIKENEKYALSPS